MQYRLPELKDKDEIISYIREHYARGEKDLSASTLLTSMKFEDWVKKIQKNVNTPDEIWGKSLTYLIFDDNQRLIGFLSIRHDLSEGMANKYGHIGIGIRPSERRKGYASKALQFALEECKKIGMKKIILGCYKENIGSAKSIMKNGGVLINEIEEQIDINGCWEIKLTSQYYEVII